MAKRKAVPGPTLELEPERVGKATLVACPACGGYGAVMLDDGDWKVCARCGGGGRVWEGTTHE